LGAGFDNKIRLEIEKNICEEGGPGLDCFAMPLELIARYLEQVYLHPFLTSKLFQNYVKDLIATIQVSPTSRSYIHRHFEVLIPNWVVISLSDLRFFVNLILNNTH
jgi:hypothetical protein